MTVAGEELEIETAAAKESRDLTEQVREVVRGSGVRDGLCQVTVLHSTAALGEPKVDSAVVRLVPRAPETIGVADPDTFSAVVRDAFGQRRKTLRNALSNLCDAAAIEAAGVRPDARAEQIEVADFVRLANSLRSA